LLLVAVVVKSVEIETFNGQIKSSVAALIGLGQELQTIIQHLTLAEKPRCEHQSYTGITPVSRDAGQVHLSSVWHPGGSQ
jgi:hypothetical protein